MVIAADDYPFLEIAGTTIVFFLGVIWIWLVITIVLDVVRRHDIGGWHKAAWIVALIALPFLGAITYLIAQHDGMAHRTAENMHEHEGLLVAQARAAGVRTDGAQITRGFVA